MLKTAKFKKKWYKDLISLYKELNLIVKDKEGRDKCNPSKVYINPKDEKLIERAIYKEFKKQYGFLLKPKLESSIAMYILNYGPVVDKAISPGYIIISSDYFDTI